MVFTLWALQVVCLGNGVILPLLAAHVLCTPWKQGGAALPQRPTVAPSHTANSVQPAGLGSDAQPPQLAAVLCLTEGTEAARWVGAAANALGCDHALQFHKPSLFWKRMRAQGQLAVGGRQLAVVLLAEPRWQETQGMVPWAALLRLWGDTQVLKCAGCLVGLTRDGDRVGVQSGGWVQSGC